MNELGTRAVEIVVAIDGQEVQYSNLLFHSRIYGSTATIYVPDLTKASKDSVVTLSYRHEDRLQLFATLVVKLVNPGEVGVKHLLCKEPYYRSMGTVVKATSWRKATVAEITTDILTEAGVAKYDLSAIPSVRLERFSYPDQIMFSLLQNLRWAVRQYQKLDLVIIPGIDGVLHFGPLASIRPDFGSSISVVTGVDILWMRRGMYGLHVLPLLYGQLLTIDGVQCQAEDVEIVVRSDRHETCAKVRWL